MAKASPTAPTNGQLSLFDSLAAWLKPVGTATRQGKVGARPRSDDAETTTAPLTSVPGAAAPVPPASEQQQRFWHPRTSRELVLGDCLIGYEFRRTRRRSIGFVVGAEGLSVAAPRWIALADVDGALRAKAGWIVAKLQQQRERGDKLRAARIDWRDGTAVRYLGTDLVVVLDPALVGAVLAPLASPPLLRVGLPGNAAPEQIREAVQSWLQRQARRIFDERSAHFAAVLGVKVRRLALSSATRRWGSASADGSIRLNWRLIHFAPRVIDYVVTHELAHLREMNHSPAFWDIVRSALPDYAERRVALVDETLPPFE
jgi:predicted metal-dependent hydrolase